VKSELVSSSLYERLWTTTTTKTKCTISLYRV